MTAAEFIARARDVTDGATPGPWETFESSTLSAGCLGVDDSEGQMLLWHHDHGIVGGYAADAAFIAASRTMLPAAVAAIEAARLVVTEAIEDADRAYADVARTNEGRNRSAILRTVLWTVRDDMDTAITAALDPS